MTSIFDRRDGKANGNESAANRESSSPLDGPELSVPDQDSSRRRFLQMTVAGTVAGLATAVGMELVSPLEASGTVHAHPRRRAAGIDGRQQAFRK